MEQQKKKEEISLIDKLSKEVRNAKRINIVSMVISICMFLLLAIASVKTYRIVQETQLIEKVSELDIKTINDTINNLNEVMKQVDWEMVSEKIADLDVITINKRINELDVPMIQEKLMEIDLKNLSEDISKTLKTVNKLTDDMHLLKKKLVFWKR